MKLFCDGEKVIMILSQNGEDQAYILNDPYVYRMDMSINNPLAEIMTIDGHVEHMSLGLSPDIDLTLGIKGGLVEVRQGKLTIGVDLFERLSIIDLLDIINKKLEKRPF